MNSKPMKPLTDDVNMEFFNLMEVHPIVKSLTRWNIDRSLYISTLSSRPSVEIVANGVTLKGLADTGAEASLVDEAMTHSMSPPPILLNPNVTLYDAQNRPLSVVGLYLCDITTPTQTLQHPMFVVRGLATQAILGWDFLRKAKANISTDDGSVSFVPRIGSVAAASSDNGTYLLEAKETVYIPASETRPVTGVITTPDGVMLSPGSDVMVESSPETNLYTPEALYKVRDNNSLRVVLRNNNAYDIEIKRKSLVPGLTIEPSKCFRICALSDKVLQEIKDTDNQCSVKAPTKIYQLSPKKRAYLLENLNLSGVDPEFREHYIEWVLRNSDIFSESKWDIGHTKSFSHTIHMSHNRPVFVPQFKIPMAHQEAVETMVKEMLRAKVIVPARSPYNSPIFCVFKKCGSLRFVQDFRSLNLNSLDDKYSIQDVRECLNQVGRSKPKIFSSIDLSGAFWQMTLSPDSRPYTAFTIPHMNQQFMWTRACMGLKGCPSSFSRYMGYIFRNFRGTCVTYIDDGLFLSQDHHEHLRLLDSAAEVLRTENLKLNVKKCYFGVRSLTFLGYNISASGISPCKDKIRAIQDMPPPSSQKQISEYIGLYNYFRSLIPGFSRLSAPLTKLTSKTSSWKSGELPKEALEAFKALQAAICAPPVVAFPDPSKPYIISTDAAHGDAQRPGGIGALLTQRDDDGNERLISCFSRGLRPHQKGYSAFAIELLSAVEALSYFEEYCKGSRTVLYTDHKPIEHHSARHSKTLSELQEKLNRYDVVVKYRPSSGNGAADAISRTIASVSSSGSLWVSDMGSEQKKDPLISCIIKFIKCKELPLEEPKRSWVVSIAPKCFIKDNLVWVIEIRHGRPAKPRLFLPGSKVQSVIRNAHGNTFTGHFKVARTMERCLQEYFWMTIATDVSKYIKRCRICMLNSDSKARAAKSLLTPWPQSTRFNERIHIDLCGPMRSITDNVYICAMTDSMTKWLELVAIPNKEAKTVAKAIMDFWVCSHSVPHLIVTDGGREFANKVLGELFKLLKAKHHVISPLHPRAAGQIERFNRTLRDYLLAFVSDSTLDWEDFLPSLKLAHNTAINRSTCATPYSLVYTQDPTLPWTLTNPATTETTLSESWSADRYRMLIYARDLVMTNNEAARQAYRQYHDKKLKVNSYDVGDRVVVHFPKPGKGLNAKLYRPWKGPYRIEKKLDFNVYIVKRLNDSKTEKIHSDRIKHFNQVDDPLKVDYDLSNDSSDSNDSKSRSQSHQQILESTEAVPNASLLENLQLMSNVSQNQGQGQVSVPGAVPIPEIPVEAQPPQPLDVSVDEEIFVDAIEDENPVVQPDIPQVPAQVPVQRLGLDGLARQLFPTTTRPNTRSGGIVKGHFNRKDEFEKL